MKKINLIFVSILMMVIFYGCPYESVVPIDTSNTPINQKLIGNWKPQDDGEVYKIKKLDDYNYAIEVEKDKSKIEYYVAFLSDVNGTQFLNLTEDKKDNSERKYLFYKIVMIDDNNMSIFPITENVREKFNTKEELKKFIAENMKNSYFYEKEGKLKKSK